MYRTLLQTVFEEGWTRRTELKCFPLKKIRGVVGHTLTDFNFSPDFCGQRKLVLTYENQLHITTLAHEQFWVSNPGLRIQGALTNRALSYPSSPA